MAVNGVTDLGDDCLGDGTVDYITEEEGLPAVYEWHSLEVCLCFSEPQLATSVEELSHAVLFVLHSGCLGHVNEVLPGRDSKACCVFASHLIGGQPEGSGSID